MKDTFPTDYQACVRMHGHSCPGLAIGYRAARIAMDRLGLSRDEDEELVAIVETDACGIDAIQWLLGCTIGKGNLIFRDYGKNVFTIISRSRNRALRLALSGDIFPRSPEQAALRAKVFNAEATAEEERTYRSRQQERLEAILNLPAEQLFTVTEVTPEIPEKARIFDSVACSRCGEMVMEPRARLRGGKPVCIPCAEDYGRGW